MPVAEEHAEHQIKYAAQWDVYLCKTCDLWLEPSCGDPDCWFGCRSRPDRPSQADLGPLAGARIRDGAFETLFDDS